MSDLFFLELERQRLFKERERLNEHFHGSYIQHKPEETKDQEEDGGSNNMQSKESIMDAQDLLSKETKDSINYSGCKVISKTRKLIDDDMEQWVSDTFYSYFPGFNNENQKRQLFLQKRQRENEENLLKHHMLNAVHSSKSQLGEGLAGSAFSNNAPMFSNNTGFHEATRGGKGSINTQNENNIVYWNHGLNSARPGSTRYKLLQDLRHTDLSNKGSANREDFNLDRKHIESAAAIKKEYQRELIQQIEEKKRSIEMLKEKEHEQERILTRRLQEQLKTIKLEEMLEKERIKATEVRFKAEHDRYMRKHIIDSLENDSKLLPLNKSLAHEKNDKENISIASENNKVYRYFSNSEKKEYNYRLKHFMPAEIGQSIDQHDFPKIEKECFHLSDKICPMCDEPLKEMEHFCLRCQSKMFLTIKMGENAGAAGPAKSKVKCKNNRAEDNTSIDCLESSYVLVCIKCDRIYSECPDCLDKDDRCRACKNIRNVCMYCRQSLCTFCLEEVACGKNSEHEHINEKSENSIKTSFQIITYGEEEPIDDNKSTRTTILSENNLNTNEEENLPYSINNDRFSIFHPDKDVFTKNNMNRAETKKSRQKTIKSFHSGDNNIIKNDSEKDIQRLRQQTDKKLMGYLKNYSELAVHSRGTQTKEITNARRGIFINGGNSLSLSIPLFCEMPKLTRRETTISNKELSSDLENLKRRWDIPAVQKLTVSPTSPKVLTQIGAIRKQLQTENLFFDDRD